MAKSLSYTGFNHEGPKMTPQVSATLRTLMGAALFLFAAFLVREFWPAMGWALLLSISTWGCFTRIEKLLPNRPTLAALVATLAVSVCLGLPFVWLGNLVSGEIHAAMAFLQKANENGMPVPEGLAKLPLIGAKLAEYWEQELVEPNSLFPLLIEKLAPHAGQAPLLLKNASMAVLHISVEYFFAMLVLFFAFLHGRTIATQARGVVSRLLGQQALPYLDLLPVTMRATVTGMVLVAIGEGIVLGLAYWVAGIPSPVTAGVATAFMAIVPGGAPISMSTASLYLYGTGHGLAAIGLLSWGFFQLFIVDHFIRPRLIGEGAKLPFLVVLFGLLGGLASFGLVGLFVGPTCTALAYKLWGNLAKPTAE
jgi:predicted PurR-regulated permease PerM